MRVVAGELRGRRIEGPPEPKNRRGNFEQVTRPTTDKVREAVFNALGSMEVVEGSIVVDMFAGSGALGIEALSRGAERCVFIENDRTALAVLQHNIDQLGLADRSTVLSADISRESEGGIGPRFAAHIAGAELVLADPPYRYDKWTDLFAVVSEASPGAVLVAETEVGASIHVNPPEGWNCLRIREYGRTAVGFFVASTTTQRSAD